MQVHNSAQHVARDRVLSLAAATVRGASISELADCATQAGFDAIGVRLSSWDPKVPVTRLPDGLNRVAARVRELGLAVLDVEQIRLRPESEAATFEYLFEGAAMLGARWVLIFADDPERSRLVARLQQLEALGKPYGARPLLEFMPFTSVRSLADALEVLTEAGVAEPRVLIDTLHLARSGSEAALADLDPGFVPFIHLADGAPTAPRDLEGMRIEATFDRLLPGEGGLPLTEYLRRLPPVPLALEVPSRDQSGPDRSRAAAAAARSLLRELEEGEDED